MFFLVPFVFISNAQSFTPDVIGSAGVFSTSAGGSMSWTIGEVMMETYSSGNNFLTQGFHQPDTSFVISVSNPTLQNISIFPNPVVDNLVIDLSHVSGSYVLEIFDMYGQIIRKEFIPTDQKQLFLSFREFANGMYLLNIINREFHSRISYKINKAE